MDSEKIYQEARQLSWNCLENGVAYVVTVLKPEDGLARTSMGFSGLGREADLKMLAILIADDIRMTGRRDEVVLDKLKDYLGWARVFLADIEKKGKEE